MNRVRVTRGLGVVAGGLLSVVAVPVAVAIADNSDFDPAAYTITPVAGQQETVTGLYNIDTSPPAVDQSIQGYQPFTVTDADGSDLGTFYSYESTNPYLTIYNNAGNTLVDRVLFVTSDVPGSAPDTSGIAPDGSVFSYWGIPSFHNVYAAIPGPDGRESDVVTDTLVTPLGNLDLSWLVHLLNMDAADVRDVLPDYITPDGDPVFTAVSGLPPATIAPQGYQQFNFLYDGDQAGTFDAIMTKTTDGLGVHTEALLVTDVTAGTAGAAPGEVPPVGSVFNTIEMNALPGFSLAYSSLPSDSGDVVNTVLNTPHGPINFNFLFGDQDVSAGLVGHSPAQPFFFGDGYTIGPAEGSQEVFTGINGLPPSTASVQGYQTFDVYDANGDSAGSFTADVTTIPKLSLSNESVALLVTDVSGTTGTVGTDPGDIPPVGSVLDYVNYGLGFGNVYYSLPTGDGPGVIKDFFLTPLGPLDISWLAQGTDASASINDVAYAGSDWTGIFSGL